MTDRLTMLPEGETRKLFVLACLAFSLIHSIACTSGYRPRVASRPLAAEVDLSALAYESLANRTGTIIVIDARYGRVLKRIARDADVQFTTSPFEIAQIVTAYAALDAGIITDKTLLPCNQNGAKTDVVGALANPCPTFFAELSKRLTPAQFKKAAEAVGFTYYGIESPTADQTLVRPVTARMPEPLSAASFNTMAVTGQGMLAKELHLAQVASSLASGTTASERFAAYIMTNARVAPPAVSFNPQALAVIRRGLVQAVDEGSAKAAALVDRKVAAMIGGENGQAICISYAPANDPELAVVVYLKEAVPRDAAEVTGKFYEYFYAAKP